MLRLFLCCLVLASAAKFTAGECRMKHDRAAQYLKRIGITLMPESGMYGCPSVGCVSLNNIRCNTLNGLANFKQANGCSNVVIVGGTEQGGPPGRETGRALSISSSACIAGFIKTNFYMRGSAYVDGAGNSYTPAAGGRWNLYYV